ncbi:MAG: Smr/MutS family protein [Pseudomonadota bacterium]|nr:Smr/MutS family protein [Pseudomonadota bacterium]
MAGRRRRRGLSAQDLELWGRVVADAAPLPRGGLRSGVALPASPEPGDKREPLAGLAPPEPEPETPASSPPPARPAPRILRPTGTSRAPAAPAPLRPLIDGFDPAAGLDRNTARKLSRGLRRPDARLDLHGMTAERAHRALIRFILAERKAGARMVLIVTGKGGRRPVDDAPFMPDRVGVLKHAVPHWLATHPLEGTVVGVYPAHQSHGGAGALYVYLKKPR